MERFDDCSASDFDFRALASAVVEVLDNRSTETALALKGSYYAAPAG